MDSIMKKITLLAMLFVCCIALFAGCDSVKKEMVKILSKEGKASDEDADGGSSGKNVLASPVYANEVITNQNQRTVTGSIAAETDKAMKSYQIDQQIQQELENQEHTFENPLIILNPFGNSPLTAVVLFQTKESYAVRVTVQGDTDETDVSGEIASETVHRIPVVGLYPDKENKVTIELLDDQGNSVNQTTVTIQTDPLPSSMDQIVKVEKSTKPSAYGLIEVSGFATPHPFAFDTQGHVRWYLSETYASYGYFPLTNGHFIVMESDIMIQTYEKPHAQLLYEMDFLGRVHQIYVIENGAHHEVIEKTPGGNLLVLTNSIDEHVEDVVQEIDRNTGEIVKSLDMREIFGDTYVDMIDWAHLNTVSYNPKDDSILISVRNVHSGIKVNWTTNELVWILGHPEFWKGTPYEDKVLQPEGDIIWHFQPHSIYEISQDLDNNPDTIQIMMFDNHWDKTRKVDFFDNLEFSYVSIFIVNEDAMTVTQPHTYEGIKSKITSNSCFDYDAGRVFFMGGYLAEETEDGRNGMIYEYDYDSEEVLNQYSFRHDFYRAYEFSPDLNTCAKPLELSGNYFKGTLRAASLNPKAKALPDEILEEGVTLSMLQQILLIKAGDHKVSKVEFLGENNNYLLDMSYTKKGEKTYRKLVYKLAVPLLNLEPDEYRIVLTYDGVRYNTDQTIVVQ